MAIKGLKIHDKYGYELGPESLLFGGILNQKTPEQRLMDDINSLKSSLKSSTHTQPTQQYAIQQNLMQRINPIYTRQQPNNSLAPMDMYRNYKQFGVMPAETNSFVPYSAPGPTTAPTSSVSTAGIGQTSSTSGGGGGK